MLSENTGSLTQPAEAASVVDGAIALMATTPFTTTPLLLSETACVLPQDILAKLALDSQVASSGHRVIG